MHRDEAYKTGPVRTETNGYEVKHFTPNSVPCAIAVCRQIILPLHKDFRNAGKCFKLSITRHISNKPSIQLHRRWPSRKVLRDILWLATKC